MNGVIRLGLAAEKNDNYVAVELPGDLKEPDGYEIYSDGVYKKIGEEALRMISTAPFYITGRLINRERGEILYVIELLDCGETELLYIDASGGPKAIVKAVEGTGVFLRGREAEEYATEFLATNWRNMEVTDQIDDTDYFGSVSFESVYGLLVDYINENEDKFEEMLWGRFNENDKSEVFVKLNVMDDFLGKLGIINKRKTLIHWKKNGLLKTDADGKHLAKKVRIEGRDVRAYVITLPYGNGDEDSKGVSGSGGGIKTGDKVYLAELSSGEKIEVKIIDQTMTHEDVGDNQITEKSPIGKALIGRRVGDIIDIEVEGKIVSKYKITSCNGRAPGGAVQ